MSDAIQTIATVVGSAVATSLASIISMAKKFGRQVGELEVDVELTKQKVQALTYKDADIEQRTAKALNEQMAFFQGEILKLHEELRAVRTMIEHTVTDDKLASYVETDAQRWQEMHRSLGHIEGALEGMKDRMRTR